MSGESVIVEGQTLEECRHTAARLLCVEPGRLRLEVLQHGEKGLFFSRLFRVRAAIRDAAPAAVNTEGNLSQRLNERLAIITAELEKLDLIAKDVGERVFEECLENYENLSEERRKEIREIMSLLPGPLAQKAQDRLTKDGAFSIRIADDKLSAMMTVYPAECLGAPVKVQDVLQRLREMGVTHGVDHVEIRRLIDLAQEKGRPIVDAVVARSTPPSPGNDGAVDFYAMPTQKEAIVREDGTVDHRGAARIAVVKKGQILARLLPPTAGTPGANVLGEPIPPAPGKAACLKAGANVKAQPNAEDPAIVEFYAESEGIMEVVEDVVHIRPTFVVKGDVDMTTGNINFAGKVLICGNVRDGFAVRAAGDIEINGAVEGCEVVSENGDVIIRKGIAGRHRCFVSAGRDVTAQYIENARVYAQGNITVRGSIMHSETVAGDTVRCLQGRGAIIGGTTKAGNLIHAKRLGAVGSPPTEFVVGISMEQHRVIRDLDQRYVSLQNAAMHVEEAIKGFEHLHADLSKLSRQEKQTLADMKMKLLVLHQQMDVVAKQRQEILHKAQIEARGCVKASSEVFDRVVIRIGDLTETVKTPLGTAAFYADPKEGRIVLGPYTTT